MGFGLTNDQMSKSAEQGAATQVWAAVSPHFEGKVWLSVKSNEARHSIADAFLRMAVATSQASVKHPQRRARFKSAATATALMFTTRQVLSAE